MRNTFKCSDRKAFKRGGKLDAAGAPGVLSASMGADTFIINVNEASPEVPTGLRLPSSIITETSYGPFSKSDMTTAKFESRGLKFRD